MIRRQADEVKIKTNLKVRKYKKVYNIPKIQTNVAITHTKRMALK